MKMSSNYLTGLYREWEILLDSLSSELFVKFRDVHDEYQAVVSIYHEPCIRALFKKWLNNVNENKDDNIKLTKCRDLAEKWREKGNNYFKISDLNNSMKYYNLSLYSAPRDDESFSLAAANRSAVLVELHKYKEALSDIDLALNNGYPNDKKGKLLKRREMCEKSLCNVKNSYIDMEKQMLRMNIKNDDLKLNDFETSYDCLLNNLLPVQHTTMEGTSGKLELKYSKHCGRYILAKEKIQRGQVLFVEKPYAFVTLPGANGLFTDVCEYCCQSNVYPVPCSDCGGSMYCSEVCRVQGWEEFHKWECRGTIKLLWPIIGVAHLALRTLLIASKENFGLQDSNIDGDLSALELLNKIKEANTSSTKMSGYHRIYNLVKNFHKMDKKDLLQYTLTSVMLTEYLKIYSDFFELLKEKLSNNSDVIEDVICCLLLRQLGQMVSSGHSLCGVREVGQSRELRQMRLATGIFPSASMMNHSCDANIMNSHHGAVLIIRASRDINAGEEVYNCYGPSYRTCKGNERRILLKGQYLFECQCSACSSSEKDNFVDKFTAFKCSKCCHPVLPSDNKCTNCRSEINKRELTNTLNNSLRLYKKVTENDNGSTLAIETLHQVYKMQSKCLAKYNSHLYKTMDSLAMHYAYAGLYEKSIELLVELIDAVKHKYGEYSSEVGHELQKQSDVMMMKLENMTKEKSADYCKFIDDLKVLNKNSLNIFYYAYGSWTPIYKEMAMRQIQLYEI